MASMNDGFDIGGDADDGMQDSSAYEMRVGVIRVGKRDYAVGLQWNTLEDPSRASEEARTYANMPSVKADVFGIRQSSSPQFAVGFKSYGHKSNMPSLAAHAARAKGGSWLGLFEVAGGYYLLAVREDAIISEFDRFFDDEQAALRAFDEVRYMTWDDVIAPSGMKIDQTSFTTLESLLEGKPPVKLQEVKKRSIIITGGLLAFMAIGVFMGVNAYLDNAAQEEIARQAEETARAAASAFSQEPDVPPPPPMPWENKIQGAKFIEKCVSDIRKFRLSIPGWTVTEFACRPENSSVVIAAALDRSGTVEDGGGSINWISRFVSRSDFKASLNPGPGEAAIFPSLDGSGNRVSVEWRIDNVDTIPVDIKTLKVGRIQRDMLQIFEARKTAVTFGAATNVNPTYWKALGFSYGSRADPLAFTDVVAVIPGTVITEVDYTVSTNQWAIKGEAYEQLPPPEKIN